MKAGILTHKVNLQRATETKDGYGATSPTWATYATPWAEIKSPSASQIDRSKSFSDTVTAVIRLRFRTDILNSDQIVDRTHTYRIEGIADPDGLRTELLIYATERIN